MYGKADVVNDQDHLVWTDYSLEDIVFLERAVAAGLGSVPLSNGNIAILGDTMKELVPTYHEDGGGTLKFHYLRRVVVMSDGS